MGPKVADRLTRDAQTEIQRVLKENQSPLDSYLSQLGKLGGNGGNGAINAVAVLAAGAAFGYTEAASSDDIRRSLIRANTYDPRRIRSPSKPPSPWTISLSK